MKVTAYEDCNGNLHKTEEDCNKADAIVDAQGYFDDDTCYCHGALQVHNIVDLSNYLERNKEWIKPIMGW